MSTPETSPEMHRSQDMDAQKRFPNSHKIYIEGSRPGIRVPMREIALSPTQISDGEEENPPVLVYDTSGPYSDPIVDIDLQKG